jgi:glycosyltransferase involved in cell wall biosynthesis
LQGKNETELQKMKPRLSVLLPVYNAEKYIRQSIESILNQTFSDFELIILDDGSKDGSMRLIQEIHDPRIKIISQSNMGLGATLNKGMQLSVGEFIARQDADDISLPDRFAKQIDFLERNRDVALVGTWAQIMDENGNLESRCHKHPTNSNELRCDLVFNNPFVHSSVMFRRNQIQEVGGYADERNAFEDFDLWSRVSHHFSVANLPEVLIYYREVSTGISKSNPNYAEWVMKVTRQNIHHFLPNLNTAEIDKIARIYHGKGLRDDRFTDSAINELINRIVKIVVPKATIEEQIAFSSKHVFRMKRNYYNFRLEAQYVGILKKITFRIKRRILFMLSQKKNMQ